MNKYRLRLENIEEKKRKDNEAENAKKKSAEEEKKIKAAEERKIKEEIDEKYTASLEVAIIKLIQDSSIREEATSFKKQLDMKSISSERRQPLSRLNINENLLDILVKEIGVKSDLDEMSRDKEMRELVEKALRGELVPPPSNQWHDPRNKSKETEESIGSQVDKVRNYMKDNGYDVNDFDIKLQEVNNDAKSKKRIDKLDQKQAAIAIAAAKAEKAEKAAKRKIAPGKKEFIIGDFEYESSGPKFDDWQNKLVDYIKSGASCIISVPTGSGKTFAMMNAIDIIIKDHNASNRDGVSKSLAYIAPSFHLSLQTYSNLKKTFSGLHNGIYMVDILFFLKYSSLLLSL